VRSKLPSHLRPSAELAERTGVMLYEVIYADPPWWYADRKPGTKFGGGASGHYPLIPDDEMLGLGQWIKTLAADNCAMFVWATGARLDFAIKVIEKWGFRYATVAFTWIKSNKDGSIFSGIGNYTASNAEFCLLGIKGSMLPEGNLVPSVIVEPRRRHSEKPSEVRERIETMYPNTRRVELFARQQNIPGWDVWGNEVRSTIPSGAASP